MVYMTNEIGGSDYNDILPLPDWMLEFYGTTDIAEAAKIIIEGVEEEGEELVVTEVLFETGKKWVAFIYDENDPWHEDIAMAGMGETRDEAIVALDYSYSLPMDGLEIPPYDS
jgi:hypothetical protein